jgi:hypothetical protein
MMICTISLPIWSLSSLRKPRTLLVGYGSLAQAETTALVWVVWTVFAEIRLSGSATSQKKLTSRMYIDRTELLLWAHHCKSICISLITFQFEVTKEITHLVKRWTLDSLQLRNKLKLFLGYQQEPIIILISTAHLMVSILPMAEKLVLLPMDLNLN